MYLNSSSSELHTGSNDQLSGIQCNNLYKNTIRYMFGHAKFKTYLQFQRIKLKKAVNKAIKGYYQQLQSIKNVNISLWIQRIAQYST